MEQSDYPPDREQSLAEWMSEWAEMERARIARQQEIQLNEEGWSEKEAEQITRIWAPADRYDEMLARYKRLMREEQDAKTRR